MHNGSLFEPARLHLNIYLREDFSPPRLGRGQLRTARPSPSPPRPATGTAGQDLPLPGCSGRTVEAVPASEPGAALRRLSLPFSSPADRPAVTAGNRPPKLSAHPTAGTGTDPAAPLRLPFPVRRDNRVTERRTRTPASEQRGNGAAPPHPAPGAARAPQRHSPPAAGVLQVRGPAPGATARQRASARLRGSAGMPSPSPPYNRPAFFRGCALPPPRSAGASPARCHYLQRESSAGREGVRFPRNRRAEPSSGSPRRGETPPRPRSLRRQPRQGRLANPQRRSGAHPPRDAAGRGRREARRGRSRLGVPSRPLARLTAATASEGRARRARRQQPPPPDGHRRAESRGSRSAPSSRPPRAAAALSSRQPPSSGLVLLFFFFPLLSPGALLRLPSSLPWSLPPLQPEPFPGRRCSALPIAAAAARSPFPRRPARPGSASSPRPGSRGRAALSSRPSRS